MSGKKYSIDWRIRDLYAPDNKYESQRIYAATNDKGEAIAPIDNLPDPKFSLNLLDLKIAQLLNKELDKVQLLGFVPASQISQLPEPIFFTQLQSQGRLFRTASNHSVSESNIVPVRIISRGKVITWENECDRLSFILVLKMTNKSVEEVDICLQLYPFSEMNSLPL